MLKKQAQTSQEGYPFKKVTQSKNKEISKLFAKLAQGCHRLNLFIFGGRRRGRGAWCTFKEMYCRFKRISKKRCCQLHVHVCCSWCVLTPRIPKSVYICKKRYIILVVHVSTTHGWKSPKIYFKKIVERVRTRPKKETTVKCTLHSSFSNHHSKILAKLRWSIANKNTHFVHATYLLTNQNELYF